MRKLVEPLLCSAVMLYEINFLNLGSLVRGLRLKLVVGRSLIVTPSGKIDATSLCLSAIFLLVSLPRR